MHTIISKFTNWTRNNRDTIVRNSFLIPIFLVVIMSISHVVSWYNLGNPISWAIYLSIAIEIFAIASISAASIKASKTTIWILFGIVTAIQIIGNVFYEFNKISEYNESFKSWIALIDPFFINWDILDHKRLLSIIQGGTLPILSLTALHFYIQFKDKSNDKNSSILDNVEIEQETEEDFYTNYDTDPEPDIDSNINDDDEYDDSVEEVDLGLSKSDIEYIMNSIDNPSPPNEELKRAVDEYNKELESNTDSPINDKSKIVESGSGLPNNSVRSDKGNNATISKARREINPKTGRFN